MSSPDDMPKTSKSRGKKRQKSRSSSSESISQASASTPPVQLGERPSTSNGHESGHSRHKRHSRHSRDGHESGHSGHSSSGHERHSSGHERHSSGQLGNHHSRRPSAGQASSTSGRSSHGGVQRPPTNMRDRLLVSNANALARELPISDETTTSSSSPHMNGHGHTTDDQQPGMSNGSRRSKKKKKKSRNRASSDADLIGFTGAFPKLATASHLDSSPDLDSQTSDELRARCRRGLMVFPREAAPAAEPAPNPNPQQQSLATSPSPMSSPIASSLSPNSDLNRNMTPGPEPEPEPEPGLVPEPEPEQATQNEPPTSTNVATTTTTTTARHSPNCDATPTATATTAATAATPSASGSPRVSPMPAIVRETELDQQEKSDDKEQKQVPAGSASRKRHYSPIESQARAKEEHPSTSPISVPSSPDFSVPSSPATPELRKKSTWVPARTPTPMRPRSQSLTQDEPSPLARFNSRFNSYDSPGDVSFSPQKPIFKAKNKLAKIKAKPKSLDKAESPFPTIDKPESPPSSEVKAPSPPPSEVKPPSPLPVEVKPPSPAPSRQSSTSSFPLKLDATDPFYRLPFAHGWKRELVLPSKSNPKRRAGDVFFISPAGKKMRSREEIIPLLEGDLTIEHFCFQRQAQEAGPEYELVRRATPSVLRSKFLDSLKVISRQSLAGKRVPKPKVPKGASPPSEGWTATKAVKGKSRMLASTSNGSASLGLSGASGSRKRGTLYDTASKASVSSSEGPPHCVKCLVPVEGRLCSICYTPKEATPEAPVEPPSLPVEPPNLPVEPPHLPVEQPATVPWQPPYLHGTLTPVFIEQGKDPQYRQECNSNEDTASAGSAMEIGEEIELPVDTPPSMLSEEQQREQRELIPVPDMEVVVIGGRKAIAVAGSPRRPRTRLVPRPPDLTSYERIYRKRIQDKRIAQDLSVSLDDAHIGVNVLTAVMKTMNMKERAVMSQVCSTWATVGRDQRVWNRVLLRDTHVANWKQLLQEMALHRTRELDMMGVRMSDPKLRLSGDLRILKSLRVLRTDACTSEFLKLIQGSLPQLVELRATCVSSQVNLGRLERMKKLRVLRLNMTHPAKAHAHALGTVTNLMNLTELSLRGLSNLQNLDVSELKRLSRLKVLCLGSCEALNHVKLGREVLPSLKFLRTLRIENDGRAMGLFPVDEIMRGLALAGGVRSLELINVDVDSEFGDLLASCCSVERLLLTPKCLHNTATMTSAVMQAIEDNANHLKVFRLGLVTQLLSASENLYKGSKKNVIPVERPVPGIPEEDPINQCSPEDCCPEEEHNLCVAFLPVERLEAILHQMMPRGRLSVAKVAMSDTTKMQFLAPGVTEND